MARKRLVTWAEVGFRNAGFRGASRGLKYALGWALATADLGREPESVEEYADVVGESRATAYRDYQAFYKAFPSEESPTRMLAGTDIPARMVDFVRSVKDTPKAAAESQFLLFTLGASPAAA